MKRRIFTAVLTFTLLFAGFLPAQSGNVQTAKANPPDPPAASPAPAPARPQAEAQSPTPAAARPQPSATRRRAYEREVYGRRHTGISKEQWIFLGAVAGTPMAIGALAGGAHGLAIGAIVGGWGAYAAHRLWNKIH